MTASRTLAGTAARASLATAFIACGATADFTGLSTEASLVDQTGWVDSDARTLYVISVFADFDNATDQLIAVFGDTNHVLSVETTDEDGFWQFDAIDGGTKVTWGMNGEMSFFSRFMTLFFDKMAGPDFDKGLAGLKEVCENIPARKID